MLDIGYPDEGAISNDGTSEAAINLDIVLKLQALLEQSGCQVILTRSDENGIYNADSTSIKEKKVSDLENYIKILEEKDLPEITEIDMSKVDPDQVIANIKKKVIAPYRDDIRGNVLYQPYYKCA